jgi:hypothetical protein
MEDRGQPVFGVFAPLAFLSPVPRSAGNHEHVLEQIHKQMRAMPHIRQKREPKSVGAHCMRPSRMWRETTDMCEAMDRGAGGRSVPLRFVPDSAFCTAGSSHDMMHFCLLTCSRTFWRAGFSWLRLSGMDWFFSRVLLLQKFSRKRFIRHGNCALLHGVDEILEMAHLRILWKKCR